MKFLYGITLMLMPHQLHAMARLSVAETRYLDLVQEHLNKHRQLQISATLVALRKLDMTTDHAKETFTTPAPDDAYKLTLHQCEKTRLLARSETIKKELQKDINERQRTSLKQEQTFINERLEVLKATIAELPQPKPELIVKPDNSESDSDTYDLTENDIDEQEKEVEWGPILTEQPKPAVESSVSAGKENKTTRTQEKKAERTEHSKPAQPRIMHAHVAKPLSKQCKQKSTKILAKAVRYVACRVLR